MYSAFGYNWRYFEKAARAIFATRSSSVIELPGNRWFRSTTEITPWDSCYIYMARKAGLSRRYARFIALPEPCPIRVRIDRNNTIVTILFGNIYPRVEEFLVYFAWKEVLLLEEERATIGALEFFPEKKIVAIMRIITRWTSSRSETTIL